MENIDLQFKKKSKINLDYNIEVSVHKVESLSYNVQVRGLPVLKIREFTVVIDRFQNRRNDEIGHYRQTLISIRL